MNCSYTLVVFFSLCGALTPVLSEQVDNNPVTRWSKDGRGGVPQFQRHILPLIGKLGCNNRACHGSFQGQNGFRLSLYGSDPLADHKALTEDQGGDGPRVNVEVPKESLALYKPTHEDDHEGGERMKAGGWQYRMFLNWIESSARHDPKNDSRVEKLLITPAEILLRPNETAEPIRLIAHFSDGTVEDVSALTIFETKDEAVAAVSDDGRVTGNRPGDTAIVATYGGEVTSCKVLVPRIAKSTF